ncbi:MULTISPECIES: hypothetical protein [Methylorubrum]|jgi:hypothetical protein|uniref:Sulfur globule protein n=2 Tax=Methylorubrum TaxID=2282523 RepID=B1Z796_METPB|nr:MULTISPECIES: hypothetical protein [Methylorubrum]ACB80329.1 conserved hypothetical protein [Methylorubrum populi BJ001]MBA8911514.1 hypothetical protein [Methylorubrum thiocyanatum]OAH37525.1 hypothetical protein AX289_12120 [Methylorubrum populi]PZP70715.1 MAG: hypothetical protein DI590_08800 [Methylorubrum populi]QDI80864.1 hypothetical protein E8E01_10660 [Methylorubrum populi]
MLRKPTLTLLSVLAFAGGILGTSSAALADPPWARGGRGFHHGGPPPWAPAHGWRRKHEYGGGYGRSYGRSRYDAGPRYGRYGY